MSIRKVLIVALLAVLGWVVAPVAEAQAPIRIGAALSLGPAGTRPKARTSSAATSCASST